MSTPQGRMHRAVMSAHLLAIHIVCLLSIAEAHRHYCPDGTDWYFYNGNCYRWSNDTKGWFGAEMQCRELGGHLVSIGSRAENTFLHAMAQCSTHFWIGMAKVDVRKKEFQWWAQGHSNYTEMLSVRSSEYQDCVYFDTSGTSRWYNTYCQTLRHYVCMTPPLELHPQATGHGGAEKTQKTLDRVGSSASVDNAAAEKNAPCPGHWLRLEDNCYFVSSDKTNYFNAQMSCEAKGATVANVLSEREQNLLTMAVGCNTQVWIGLEKVRPCFTNPSQSYCWLWMDRTPLGYSAWHPGYPSSTKEVECAISDGRWRSTNCYNEHRYICKK